VKHAAIALGLLLWASTASAECSWTLWRESYGSGVNGGKASSWSLVTGVPTFPNCVDVMKCTIQSDLDSGVFKLVSPSQPLAGTVLALSLPELSAPSALFQRYTGARLGR
jgi:hypothetical protein